MEFKKLSGGSLLLCGHQQVISEHRQKLAAEGRDQFKVFCVECNDWSRVVPRTATEE